MNTLPDEPDYLDDEAPEAVEPAAKVRKYARRTKSDLPADDMIEMRLIRGYWPLDGRGKVQAGQVISVPREEARVLIATGGAERAAPVEI